MRRPLRILLRLAALALLAAAAFDVHASSKGPARRVYVVDASASVLARGAPDSLHPDDARRMIEADLRASRPSDLATILVAGRSTAVASPLARTDTIAGRLQLPEIDGSATDLASALRAAAGIVDGGDIVLFSDGRSTSAEPAGAGLRGARIHVVPLGPVNPVDARIRSIAAPAIAPPGTRFQVRISVAASTAWKGELIVRADARADRRHPLSFDGPAVQDVVVDDAVGAGVLRLNFQLRGESPDACPANDTAAALVWIEEGKPRIAVVSLGPADPWPGATLAVPEALPAGFDVLVVHSVSAESLGAEALRRLQRDVQDGGAGLVLVGGPDGFAPGGWAGTPLEELSPLWAFPDERSAVAVVLDASGSMAQPPEARRIDLAAAAVKRAASLTHADDELALIAFSSEDRVIVPMARGRAHIAGALARIRPEGSTQIAQALRSALAQTRASTAGRKCIVLITDGETLETPEALRSAAADLARDGAKLVIVRLGPAEPAALRLLAEEARGEVIDGSDPGRLDRAVAEALSRSRDLYASPPDEVSGFAGLPPFRIARMHRCGTRPGAEIAARAGSLPLVAFRPAGRGRVAAVATSPETGWWDPSAPWGDVWRAVIDRVAPSGGGRTRVSVEVDGGHLVIRARCAEEAGDAIRAVLHEEAGAMRDLELQRRGQDLFECRTPRPAGPATLRIGGRVAATTPSLPPAELEALGPDLEALAALARSTGGSLVRSPSELRALPRVGPPAPRSHRIVLIAAALLAVLADLVVGTFLKG